LVGLGSIRPVLPELGAHPEPGRLVAHLPTFKAIEPIDALVVDPPGLPLQEGVDPPVAAQPGVLLLQLPELTDLRGHQSPKLLLPALKGLLADPHLAGDLAHLGPLLGLLQGKGNLLISKTGPLHRENPSCQIFSS